MSGFCSVRVFSSDDMDICPMFPSQVFVLCTCADKWSSIFCLKLFCLNSYLSDEAVEDFLMKIFVLSPLHNSKRSSVQLRCFQLLMKVVNGCMRFVVNNVNIY